jgi:hypothetical protein
MGVSNAVRMIQLAAKRFLLQKHRSKLELKSACFIQRVVRGGLTRLKHKNITRLLTLRREQKIAQKVVLKLQSIWRR